MINTQRRFSLLLVLLLLCCQGVAVAPVSSEAETAEGMILPEPHIPGDEDVSDHTVFIQDFGAFFIAQTSSDYVNDMGQHVYSYRFTGSQPNLNYVYEYIRLLPNIHDYIELNDSLYDKVGFYDWIYTASLQYIGSIPVGPMSVTLSTSPSAGHITLTCGSTSSSLRITLSEGIEFKDFGYRRDGKWIEPEIEKRLEDYSFNFPSLCAELIENADGIFQTSDGRLKTAAGSAMVLLDSQVYYSNEVSIQRKKDKNDGIYIEYFRRNDSLYMVFPYKYTMTGDEMDLETMGCAEFIIRNKYDIFLNTKNDYAFSFRRDNEMGFAQADGQGDITFLDVRVLRWDEQNGIAVIYVACQFAAGAYQTLECLAAIPF